MAISIDADAAKLAGLQIDLLQKFRSGKLTLAELALFLKLAPKDRANRFGDWKQAKADFLASTVTAPPVEPEKFTLLRDLGVVVVPEGYDHFTALTTFKQQNRSNFYSYNDSITDANFHNPSRILKAGDRLRVKVFQQIVAGETSSVERMEFLRTEKAIFTGAQGAALVFEQKRDQLPKGKWYASFDEADRLWQDADLDRRVPRVGASSGGGFEFGLGGFGYPWDQRNAFLCFCDEFLDA